MIFFFSPRAAHSGAAWCWTVRACMPATQPSSNRQDKKKKRKKKTRTKLKGARSTNDTYLLTTYSSPRRLDAQRTRIFTHLSDLFLYDGLVQRSSSDVHSIYFARASSSQVTTAKYMHLLITTAILSFQNLTSHCFAQAHLIYVNCSM